MERQVRIKNTISNNWETHTVTAETFGDLQDELGTSWSDNKVIVRETKTTLDLKGAKLPDGDFTLFIMPKRTKAGSSETSSKEIVIILLKEAINKIESLDEAAKSDYFEIIERDFERVRKELDS